MNKENLNASEACVAHSAGCELAVSNAAFNPFAALYSRPRKASAQHATASGYIPRAGSLRNQALQCYEAGADEVAKQLSAKDVAKLLRIDQEQATQLVHALVRQGSLERVPKTRERIIPMKREICLYGLVEGAVPDKLLNGSNTWRIFALLQDAGAMTVRDIASKLDIAEKRVHAVMHVTTSLFEKKGGVQTFVDRAMQETSYQIKKVNQ